MKTLEAQDAQLSETTIGEIVTKDYRTAQVFKSFGIDFCCGGKKTVAEVCERKGIDFKEVEKALQLTEQDAVGATHDYQSWSMTFLTDYIINTHHRYVKDNTLFITEIANKVARVHGDQHPEVIRVAELFNQVGAELLSHLNKEEMVLFPFIKELDEVLQHGGSIPGSTFGTVSQPIQMMEAEHEHAGELLHEIREVTHNFTLPAGACNSYTILYKKLDEFENDLHWHVHLENNILFPRALAAEKDLPKID
ncbi:iron-sulfur cluster repair di-iron protein [Pedobacter sp. AW31-3R]|uniref:iron-sulfur cluster repair di-iron protein n=1 Tax=Pedobacter sp. AW31-3R TaxID=3445781 RepID=UPI003F9F8F4A